MKSSDLLQSPTPLGRKEQGKQKIKCTIMTVESLEKMGKESKGEGEKFYYFFPFVAWIGFGCLSGAAALAPAATSTSYSLF